MDEPINIEGDAAEVLAALLHIEPSGDDDESEDAD